MQALGARDPWLVRPAHVCDDLLLISKGCSFQGRGLVDTVAGHNRTLWHVLTLEQPKCTAGV